MSAKKEFVENSTKNQIRQFVCFKLAEEEYALDITYVKEVIRVPRVTYIPQMPDFCQGVINIRGNVIGLFDLKKILVLKSKEHAKIPKILVTSIDGLEISLVVDEILENIKLHENEIEPAPSVKMHVNRACIQGVAKPEKRLITLLDLPKIHETIKQMLSETKTELAIS